MVCIETQLCQAASDAWRPARRWQRSGAPASWQIPSVRRVNTMKFYSSVRPHAARGMDPTANQSDAAAKSSASVMSSAFATLTNETMPGFCAPRSMLLM